MLHDATAGLFGVLSTSTICLPRLRFVVILSSAALTTLGFRAGRQPQLRILRASNLERAQA